MPSFYFYKGANYNDSPRPIVNSVCPGLVRTDVSRELTAKSIVHRSVTNLLLWFKGLAPEEGAKSLVLLGKMLEKDHGKFTCTYLSDEEYPKYEALSLLSSLSLLVTHHVTNLGYRAAAQNVTGEKGQVIQAAVWEEILGILKDEL